MAYNWRNTLPNYASVSGVLAGFSLTFIVFTLGKETANSQLAFGISWSDFAVIALGTTAVLFIAAMQYFLTAKGCDVWNLSDSHLKSLSERFEKQGVPWDRIVITSLESCRRNEARGRRLYNYAIFGLFVGLFFAIGPFSLLVAVVVLISGAGSEIIQVLQHRGEPPPQTTGPAAANAPKNVDRKEQERECYVKLAQNEPTIEVEDLRVLFGAELDRYSNFWIFAVGLVITTLVFLSDTTQDIELQYRLSALLGGYVALILMYRWLVSRRNQPSSVGKTQLKCYLTAKEMLSKSAEQRRAYVCPVHGTQES